MGAPLSVISTEITEKAARLTRKYAALLERFRLLNDTNAALLAENKELKNELHKARLDNQFLTLSHRLADTPDALAESRKMIADMIRDIDKCIAQLND